MTYLWLKALHVAAAFTFVGGTLADALALAAGHSASRRWSRTVTTPAMLLVWAFGLTMALRAGWFSSRWLPVKLAFVVALSGMHGVQSGLLRRVAGGRSLPTAWHLAAPTIVASAAVIAVLVVVKRF